MKPPEVACSCYAFEKNTCPQNTHMNGGVEIEASNAAEKDIRNNQIKKSPKHIDHRRRETLARRFCKWALKGMPHRAADKMRNGVCKKNATKEVGDKVNPFHFYSCLDKLTSAERI